MQWCNYNKRRQKKNKRTSIKIKRKNLTSFSDVSQSSDTSFFSSINNEKSESLKSVQNMMIQIHWNMNHSTFCRSQDLLVLNKLNDMIKMNNLNFSKFISLIVRELSYNNKQDIIIYECVEVINMHIVNKLK